MVWISLLIVPAFASQATAEDDKTVEQIAEIARDSVVIVSVANREGDEEVSMGAGFAIAPDLIATNLHVIDQARPIQIRTRKKQQYDVTEVFASDKTLDLAILRINSEAKLTPLKLAAEPVVVGQSVVGIGHPYGLNDSVLSGRIAGEETIRGMRLWQVAMTIEPGSSGGPLLDMFGRVHGVIAMKSLVKESFGFAIQVDQLKKLLDTPNPVSMKQWQTIGRVDANRWKSKFGAQWRQRGGRLSVEGAGTGFGGRALLLRKDEPPKLPFEIAVSVKLDDKRGAAGLVFHSDDGEKHYGFYPSGGNLRLTSFEGPSVFTWNVVREIQSEHYRPGAWNELRVRVEKKSIVGYVNGQEVLRVADVRQPAGSIGLCKFRDTKAEFKNFRFGETVDDLTPSKEKLAELTRQLDAIGDRSTLLDIDLVGQTTDVAQRLAVLENQAREFEAKAETLRMLGQDIHTAAVCSDLSELVANDDADIDLFRGALLIAKLDNPDLDIEVYAERIDDMAKQIRTRFTDAMSSDEKLKKLDEYLFEQNGFHGSRSLEYYSEENSYLDRVLDDREGIPITLSVVYMSVAKRLGLNVVGVGLPGHFVVRHEPKDDAAENEPSSPRIIDVFERGNRLTRNQANVMVYKITRRSPSDADFATSSNREMLIRMLRNLSSIAESKKKADALLRYLEALVTLEPNAPQWRGTRAVWRHKMGRTRAALDDLDWILEKEPEGLNLEEIRRMRNAFAEAG